MDDVFHAHNVKKQNVDNDKENSYCMHGMRTLIMLLNQHYFLNKQAYCCRSSFCLLHYIIAFRVFLAWYLIQLFTLPWPNYHYAADNLQTKSQQKDLQFTFSLAGCSCQRCYYTTGRLNVFTFPWLNKIELKASCRSPAYVLQTFQTSDLQACWMRSNRLKKDQSADLLVPYGSAHCWLLKDESFPVYCKGKVRTGVITYYPVHVPSDFLTLTQFTLGECIWWSVS